MFCKKCGNQLVDNTKFCGKCGTPITSVPTNVAAPVQPEAPAPAAPVAPTPVAPVVQTPVAPVTAAPAAVQPVSMTNSIGGSAAALKKHLGTILVIIAIVLYTIVVIGKTVNTFNTEKVDINDYYSDLDIDELDEDIDEEIEDTIDDFTDTTTPITIGAGLVGLIPMLLIAVGLWLNFAQAYNKKGFSTVGFSLIKSAMIIRIVFSALLILVLVAGFFLLAPVIEEAFDDILREIDDSNLEDMFESISTLFPVIMIGAAISQILPLLHSIFALSTAGSMKKIARTGESKNRKYIGLCVMNYIYVAMNAISLIAVALSSAFAETIVDAIKDTDMLDRAMERNIEDVIEGVFVPNAWSIISTVLIMAALVLFSISLSDYAKKQAQA